jgi:Flp pilus assembly protein TadG
MISSIGSWFRRPVRSRFANDSSGAAAVEFAMLLPIMFMLFYGTIEFSQALTVDRRVTQIASATADLVARTKETTTGEIDQIMLIVDELMKPYDPTLLRISLMNVVADINDASQTTVCWVYEHNGGANASATQGAAYALPAGVVEKGDSVVVAEVAYNYDPPLFGFIIENTIQMTETFYLKPRLSATIDYNGNKCL